MSTSGSAADAKPSRARPGALPEPETPSDTVLVYPDPRLRQVAAPVGEPNAAARTLAVRMTQLMHAAGGVGLAAPQLGVPRRLIVVDVGAPHGVLVLLDPAITAREGTVREEEGCLSFPEVFAEVTRAARVTVQYRDLRGQARTLSGEGLLAVALQHEVDHLDGTLLIDRVGSRPARREIERQLQSRARRAAQR